MTPQQVDLVQESYQGVKGLGSKAGELFYARLFELNPSLRTLFKGDIPEQSAKLIQMITVAVNGLRDFDALRPAVQDLGARHRSYGVEPAHYTTVGAALLDTLALGLGNAFTEPVRDAWATCYTLIADEMQTGSHNAGTVKAATLVGD